MTSNDNQVLSPSNIWSHFLSGRWNSPRPMVPMMPPNLMFPYLSMNRDLKQTQPEMPGNPYTTETMQLFRTMIQRQSLLMPMQQNNFPRHFYGPPHKSNDTHFSISQQPNQLPSPDHKSTFLSGETNFENVESNQSDMSNLRCPVCHQSVKEYELESHLHQELNLLIDTNNRVHYKESCSGATIDSSSRQNSSYDHDRLILSNHNDQWKSKLPFQNSISRYRNFEKMKINRLQRRNTASVHNSTVESKSPLIRALGTKTQHNNFSDFSISSKKLKTTDVTNDLVDIE